MSAMNAQEPNQRGETGKVRLLRRRARSRVSLRHRMPADKLRRGVYLIPSLFTAGNLMCGFFSIIATFNGEFINAALFIILANILDGIDGYAARLTRTSTQFGVEFDSLADVVSFGVAPAVLVYLWALVPWQTWGWLAACTYVVCGALRLSRFNVQAMGMSKNHFVGLPIPAAAQMATMPPSLLATLPRLPAALEYRVVGNTLVLRDVEAGLIIDFIPAAVPR